MKLSDKIVLALFVFCIFLSVFMFFGLSYAGPVDKAQCFSSNWLEKVYPITLTARFVSVFDGRTVRASMITLDPNMMNAHRSVGFITPDGKYMIEIKMTTKRINYQNWSN